MVIDMGKIGLPVYVRGNPHSTSFHPIIQNFVARHSAHTRPQLADTIEAEGAFLEDDYSWTQRILFEAEEDKLAFILKYG